MWRTNAKRVFIRTPLKHVEPNVKNSHPNSKFWSSTEMKQYWFVGVPMCNLGAIDKEVDGIEEGEEKKVYLHVYYHLPKQKVTVFVYGLEN